MRRLMLVAALALSACAPSPDGASADRTAVIRQSALNLLELYVATKGPVANWSKDDLLLGSAACATATSIVTVYRPDVPEASEAILDACSAVLLLLGGKAAPAAS